jgi:hypothetical protein
VPAPTSVPAPGRRSTSLDSRQRAWIARADTFFIASFHPDGGADASHRGGEAGSVRIGPDGSLEFTDCDGNSMFNTFGNLAEQPRAGLLFLDFDRGDALQLTGEAALDQTPGASTRIIRFAPREIVERPGGGVRIR